MPEAGHGANLIADLPAAFLVRLEIFLPQRIAEPARDIDLAKDSGTGPRNCLIGNIAAEQPNVIAIQITQGFAEKNGNAVEFLPGGTGGAPDSDQRPAARPDAPVDQLGNNLVPQHFEWRVVPEKQRFASSDFVDHAPAEFSAEVRPRHAHELRKAVAPLLLGQVTQPSFNEVILRAVQRDRANRIDVTRHLLALFRQQTDHATLS